MSQLDYLWTHFGNYEIATNPDDNADALITQKTLQEYLKNYIADLALIPKEGSVDKLQLVAYAADKSIINSVEIDKEDYLVQIDSMLSTQVEIDNNICNELDVPLLVFTMKNGKKLYLNVSQFNCTGVETSSIKTQVVNNRIAAHLKIDRSLEVPVVDVDITDGGLRVDLSINPDKDKQLKLVKTKNGLDTTYTWENGDNILFDIVSFDQYKLLRNPIKGKIYFIPDENCIYLNGVKYDGKSTNTGETIENTDKGLEVRIDPDEDNLLTKTNAGLSAKLYWDE